MSIPNWKFKHKVTLIKGQVQSGKTRAIIDLASHCVSSGKSCLIIVRNVTHDLIQLKNRFKAAKKKISVMTVENYRQLMTDQNAKVMLTLANFHQLEKFLQIAKHQKKLVTIIDEADHLDTGKGTLAAQCISLLKNISQNIFMVTATAMDTVLQEELHLDQVIHLPTPPDYKGIDYITWPGLNFPISTIKGNYEINDILEADPNIPDYLEAFSAMQPLYSKVYQDHHPVLHLIKFCRLKISMERLQDFIRDAFPEEITSIILNSDGIRLYTFKPIHNKYFGQDNHEGYYLLPRKTHISAVLKQLKNYGGVKRFPRILIIAGDMAGRSVTFSSEDYDRKNSLIWHLTGMYLTVSKSTSQPELIQSLRVCCRAKDELPISVYCLPETRKAILKSANLQEEYFTRATDPVESLDWQFVQMPVNKFKFASGHKVTKNVQVEFNKVSGPDGYHSSQTEFSHEYELNSDGQYSITLVDRLPPVSKRYFDALVETVLTLGCGLNEWVSKAELIEAAITNGFLEKSKQTVTNTTYSWHAVKKGCEQLYFNTTDSFGEVLKETFIWELRRREWFVMYKK